MCGCFWQLFKVSVEGPLVLGEGMTQPLRVWDLCKVKSRAERPEGGVPEQDCLKALAFPVWLTVHLARYYSEPGKFLHSLLVTIQGFGPNGSLRKPK